MVLKEYYIILSVHVKVKFVPDLFHTRNELPRIIPARTGNHFPDEIRGLLALERFHNQFPADNPGYDSDTVTSHANGFLCAFYLGNVRG